MKTKFLILLILSGIGFSTSCGHDANDPSQEKSIDGTWYLINVRGGLASTSVDYLKGIVRWTFNQTNNTLTVGNTTGNGNGFILNGGNYTYSLEQNGQTQIIFLDNGIRLEIISLNGNLQLSDGFNDGYFAEFVR